MTPRTLEAEPRFCARVTPRGTIVATWAAFLVIAMPAFASGQPAVDDDRAVDIVRTFNGKSLRAAIADLMQTFGNAYPDGRHYLRRLSDLEARVRPVQAGIASPYDMPRDALLGLAADCRTLEREALMANPLLDFDELLLVRHDAGTFRLPRNDICYSGIPRRGYDCEIAVLSPVGPGGTLRTLFKPEGGRYVADVDLHFEADRLLFTMPGEDRWQVFEIAIDGTGLHQVTPTLPDAVDNFDACYLPDGNIVYCSTANIQSVPCYNGIRQVGGLYLLETGTGGVRQLTFDQDDDSYPTVTNTGQLMYTRWEYAGTPHFFTRLIFRMNPDGTNQEAVYGTNSYWPNAIYHARCLPGTAPRFVGIVSGHHGDRRCGELVIFEPSRGQQEAGGVVQRIGTPGRKVEPIVRDQLVDGSWPKFMHPWPLSDKYFLVACKPSPQAGWGIYLADAFDNLLLIRSEPGQFLLEPVPLRRQPTPPVLAERVDLRRDDALVYMVDVYEGPGLRGVPRGSVKQLRLVSPHYGYFGNAGWLNVAVDGTWDVQRILGTVPVHEDGSAYFRVPANTPISIQPLDEHGKAVQLMRSWFTAMPGEFRSCVGCHESTANVAPNVRTQAMSAAPAEIEPWLGPARGFDFERDLQPVLDAHCVKCHNGQPQADGCRVPDLRPLRCFPDYKGIMAPVPKLQDENHQLPPDVTVDDIAVETSPDAWRRPEYVRFTPAYEALHPHVRRGGSESDARLLTPCEFHADTSPLVQMLCKGHHGVRLDTEAWSRLITWIDLNVPCHGTWHEVYPIPFDGRQRRYKYLQQYAGIDEDYEAIPDVPPYQPVRSTTTPPSPTTCPTPAPTAAAAAPPSAAKSIHALGFPFDTYAARVRQTAAATACGVTTEREIEIGPGVTLRLVLVPAGEFVMGDARGSEDERPLAAVRVDHPFWMAACEITNRVYALFDPAHDSGHISQLGVSVETLGYAVNAPGQPVVRVSCHRAEAFCDWLSSRTGERFSLPTEAQWEYACRAGTATRLWYGTPNAVFSAYGNMADRSLGALARRDRDFWLYSEHPDWVLRDDRSTDNALVSASVGSYEPNAWGLHDMHGNVAEWTRTAYRPYPYHRDDGRIAPGSSAPRVVRGGSWHDRPHRCASGFRLRFAPWQRIYNVGFRVVCEIETDPGREVRPPPLEEPRP